MRSKKTYFTHLFSWIAVVVVFQACTNNSKQDKLDQNKPISVVTALPLTTHTSNFEVSGRVEAIQSAGISTRIMGYITHINVKVGDKVNKGQLLVSIENKDIKAKKAQTEAMLSEAEAALSNAKKDYERFTQLYTQQSATAKESENINLQYSSAKARVEAALQMRNEAAAMFSYTELRSPFSGMVTQKMADVGSMATPGMPLLTIEQSGEFQVSAIVPETEIGKIQKGQKVAIIIKSTGKTFNAKVDELSASSLSSGGQYLVRINVPDNEKKGLFSGQYTNVQFYFDETISKSLDNIILVPLSNIINKDQLTGLYTISQSNTALLRWVRLGKKYGSNIEVLSGLASNEKIIIHADGKLWNGVLVKEKQ